MEQENNETHVQGESSQWYQGLWKEVLTTQVLGNEGEEVKGKGQKG